MRSSCASARSRGMRVTSPTMPGIASRGLRRDAEPTAVPPRPQRSDPRERRLGNVVDEPVVETGAEGDVTHQRHRHEIARHVDGAEAVVLLELAEAVLLLSPV